MANLREIRLYPDPVLKEKAKAVLEWDSRIPRLIESMAEVMYDRNGVGLAAPQIGVSLRVIVADVGEGLIAIVNPEIVGEEDEDAMEEGCLSVPGAGVDIRRAKSITAKGLDGEGKELALRTEGLLARVIQHEIDHLNGVLIIDRLPQEERLRFDMEYSKEAARTGQAQLPERIL